MIRVAVPQSVAVRCRSEAELQFLIRLKLREAGAPIGPWNSSAPTHGTLLWYDDFSSGEHVIEWYDAAANARPVHSDSQA